MKKILFTLSTLGLLFTSCSSDDDNTNIDNSVVAPSTYVFERNGETSISFTGQTNRILMAEEIITALKNPSFTEIEIDNMFNNPDGEDPFENATLNAATQTIRSKTAASNDFFNGNASATIVANFDGWITQQVADVYPVWTQPASAGIAGQIQEADNGSFRYVNAKGLELNQAFNKSLIGAMMVDQILNNYISSDVLDNFEAANDAETLVTDKNYTDMEHDWDEAYGYLFGTASNLETPLVDIGDGLGGSDSFLNKYLDRVNDDSDFSGIAQDIYDALKLGRAAIVAKNYEVRNQQAEIVREKISEVIGVRAVHYLQSAKSNLGTDNASAFHDLSEAYGFIFSLQFTRQPNSDVPYFTNTEVEAFLATLLEGNGFWDLTESDLDTMSETIADAFNFTVAQTAL